jgi:arabinofuranosyltransferase
MNKETPDATNKRTTDALVLMLLMALTALFAWRFVNFSIPPFEDAAMLMRYSDHLAHGKGIVWNIGDAPVDGATDFLFMVVVALVRHIGLSLEAAVRVITISSHFLAVALVYLGMRRLQHSGIIPAGLSAAYVAVGPGLFLSAAYFGTPFFALAVAVAWLSAQRLMSPDGRTISGCFLFALSCLAVGLIRPEGVLISFFMLAAVSLMVPLRELRRITIVFGAIFLVFGGAYVVWRWHYFGYPLPNPFYKKGGGHLYITGLVDSVQNSYNLLYPLIPAFLLSIRRTSTLRMGIAFLVPIVGSVAMWVLLSNEMNFGGRFQYPIFLIGILSWFPLVRTLGDDLRLPKFASLTGRQKLAVGLVALSILGLVFRRQVKNSVSITYVKDGRYDMAVMLSDYADRGYMIATTEAGLLPFYSTWRAIDTWGLNDKWIAHHGLITEGYLNQRHPDIIMWHGHFSPLHPQSPEISATPWGRQILALKSYAEHNHFTLAAVFGVSPENTHYYYVRSDLPEHDEIVQRIRSLHYVWYENGGKCENYAGL